MQLDLGGSENILLLFSNVMTFILFIKPLQFLFEKSEQDEEISLAMLVRYTFTSSGPILIVSLVMMGLVYVGIGLFVLPGIVLFPFLFLLPFMYEQDLTLKEWILKTIKFHNEHLFSIWIQLVLWSCFMFLIWTGVLYFLSLFEMTPFAFSIVRMAFCLFVYPYVIFAISDKIIEVNKGEKQNEYSYI